MDAAGSSDLLSDSQDGQSEIVSINESERLA